MSGYRQALREPVNVEDALERDRIERRFRQIRANAVQAKRDIEYWNNLHPNEKPVGTAFEDAVIAWCDFKGPEPTMADVENSQ